MAYHNTGYARRKILTVTKGSYSQEYNICAAFTLGNESYPALSDAEFAQLNKTEYEERRRAFCEYVYGEEDGLQDDCPDLTLNSVIYDTTSCPLV